MRISGNEIIWHEREGNRQQFETTVTRNIVFLYSYLIILYTRDSANGALAVW